MSEKLTLQEWLQGRLDNCHRLASTPTMRGKDRDGWLEDAEYFAAAINELTREAPPAGQGATAVAIVQGDGFEISWINQGPEPAGTKLYLAPAHGEREPLPDVELVSEKVHAAWIASKHEQGVRSRYAEDGEELMVPYSFLTEKSKQLDRNSVLAVYAAIRALATPAKQPDAEGGASPEIREAGGRLDEVVAKNCFFHLEQMSDTHWWMAVTSGGVCVHINLSSKAKIIANAESEPEALPAVPEKKS